MTIVAEKAKQMIAKSQSSQNMYVDKKRSVLTPSISEQVVLLSKLLPEIPGASKPKLAPRWIGSFDVLFLTGPYTVNLKNLPVWAAVHDAVNVEKLEPTTGPPGTALPPPQ